MDNKFVNGYDFFGQTMYLTEEELGKFDTLTGSIKRWLIVDVPIYHCDIERLKEINSAVQGFCFQDNYSGIIS